MYLQYGLYTKSKNGSAAIHGTKSPNDGCLKIDLFT